MESSQSAITDPHGLLTDLISRMPLEHPRESFPMETFNCYAEGKERIDALSKMCDNRLSSLRQSLQFYSHPGSEQIVEEIRTLENHQFKIGIFQNFFDHSLTKKNFCKDIKRLVSELYNKLNYAVCASSGHDCLDIYEKIAKMAAATAHLPPHTQRECMGLDLEFDFDDD